MLKVLTMRRLLDNLLLDFEQTRARCERSDPRSKGVFASITAITIGARAKRERLYFPPNVGRRSFYSCWSGSSGKYRLAPYLDLMWMSNALEHPNIGMNNDAFPF